MNEIDTYKEILKIRYELEEIKEELYDQWHANREQYIKRVDNALAGNPLRIKIFFAIDSIKSVKEIETEVKAPHVSVWRAFKHLHKEGLTRKVGSKSGSPIYAKKLWAKALNIDEYVKEKYQIGSAS